MRRAKMRERLGIAHWMLLGLALLALPRVIAHDLWSVGPVVNALLVFGPLAAWLAVVLWSRVPNAFLTLLAVGAVYGVLLGATHIVLWENAFATEPPSLGGILAGVLPPAVESALIGLFVMLSSLVTGVFVGAVTGITGFVLSRLVPGFQPRRSTSGEES